jgi:hypothetical protein
MNKNINPKYNPRTTYTGVLFLSIALGLFIAPMFLELKAEIHESVKWIFLTLGAGLYLAPDTILDVFDGFLRRKSENM